jgi:hypothetical protein
LIPASTEQAGWQEWLEVINFLRDLSTVLLAVQKRDNAPSGGKTWRPPVFVIDKSKLSEIASTVTKYSGDLCRAIIDSLILNPKAKSLDSWDQPLLPFSDEKILLLPSLTMFGHPKSMIEDFIIENVGAETLDERNTGYEKYIAQIMEQGDGAQAITGLEFYASDDATVEFDVFVWWNNNLILLEAKCQRSSYDSPDEYRVLTKVEEAIRQLVRRRNLIQSDWDSIKREVAKRRSDIVLPDSPPPADNIICIAVTNNFRYSSLIADGVVVTDDVCLNRYFGSLSIPATMTMGESQVQIGIGRIRKTDDPTPDGLFEYLAAPIQIALVRDMMELTQHQIDNVDDEAQIIYYSGIYKGSSGQMLSSLTPDGMSVLEEMSQLLDSISFKENQEQIPG